MPRSTHDQNAISNKFPEFSASLNLPLLGLALVGDRLDGLLHSLLISEELHRDNRLKNIFC